MPRRCDPASDRAVSRNEESDMGDKGGKKDKAKSEKQKKGAQEKKKGKK